MTQLHHQAPAAAPPTDRVRGLLARMTLEEKLAQLVGLLGQGRRRDRRADAGDRSPRRPVSRTRPARPRPPHPRVRHPAGGPRRAACVAVGPAAPAASRDPARHPRAGARGVPDRAGGLAGGHLPDAARVGRGVRPGAGRREMGAAIGASMRALGIHQGLAPVLDVVRDPRWGRVEECIAEDPYLVGTLGTSYVRGLQRAGVHATLKHFVGLLGLAGGPQLRPGARGPARDAPTSSCRRSRWRCSTAAPGRSCTPTPRSTACRWRPTRTCSPTCCASEWGFDGTVVADYFGVAFLHLLHGVAADLGDAAGQALAAGVDIELPTGDAYLEPLAAGGARRAPSTRRSWTGRCCAPCRRRRSSGCSTRPSRASRRPRWTWTAPSTATSPAGSPRSRSSCSRNDGMLPLAPPAHGRGGRPERAPARGDVRLLLVREPRAPAPPRDRSRHRGPHGARGAAATELPGSDLRSRRRAATVDDDDTSGFDAAARRGCGRRRRGGRRRRPGRAVRPRHRRRGLRPGRPRAARRAARAGRGGARHRDAGRPGAAHRPAVRGRLGARRAARPSCRRSSPARRAAPRSPACCRAGEPVRAGCR